MHNKFFISGVPFAVAHNNRALSANVASHHSHKPMKIIVIHFGFADADTLSPARHHDDNCVDDDMTRGELVCRRGDQGNEDDGCWMYHRVIVWLKFIACVYKWCHISCLIDEHNLENNFSSAFWVSKLFFSSSVAWVWSILAGCFTFTRFFSFFAFFFPLPFCDLCRHHFTVCTCRVYLCCLVRSCSCWTTKWLIMQTAHTYLVIVGCVPVWKCSSPQPESRWLTHAELISHFDMVFIFQH